MIVLAATVLNALWQDALLVICVWLLMRAWPRINASTRYAVWSATLVAAIVVPIVTTFAFFTPPERVVATAVTTTGAVRAPMTRALPPPAAPALPAIVGNRAATAASSPLSAPTLPERLRVTLPWRVALGVFVVWALLAGYALIGLAIGLWRLEALKRDALPLPLDYRDAMPQWVEANKGRRAVRLCVSDAIDVPVAVGLFDAMILIPRELLERLTPGEVEQISLHELAHLRRADDWTNCLQRVIVAALGWNPAALFVAQQLELEREVACDDWVLASTGAVRPYALCLTKMAETAAWPHHPMPAPGVFTTRKQISLRIERLLGTGRNIATNLAIGPTAAAVAAVGAIALVIGFVAPSVAAPVEIVPAVAATTAQPAATAQPEPKTESAAAKPAPTAKPKTIVVHVVQRVPVNFDVPVDVRVPVRVPDYSEATNRAMRDANTAAEKTTASAMSAATKASADATKAGASAAAAGLAVAKVANVDAMVHGIIAKSRASVKSSTSTMVAQSGGRSCVGCDLQGVDWAGRDLHGANYTGVDFSNANLAGANLSEAVLNGVDFTRANLQNVSFRHAHLTGCDFSHANLSGADFTNAWMSGCEFTGARLATAQVRDILNDCKGCDFSHADLAGLNLSGIRMNGADFTHADLRNVNFSGAEIVGTDFSNARLDGANFAGATLNGCDLDGVDLSRVDFSKTKMIGMDYSQRNSPP